MKQIKVYITAEQWAEKRLQLMCSSYIMTNGTTSNWLDQHIEQCGFVLIEEKKPEQPQPNEIPTDKVEAVKYFLNQLPEGYKQRALGQVDEKRVKSAHGFAKNFAEALWFFADWEKTKEGDPFWRKLFMHYDKPTSNRLPPLQND